MSGTQSNGPGKWHHQDGKIGCSWLSSLHKKNNYSRTKQQWENPRTRGEAEALPVTAETKTDCIRRIREAATCWRHRRSPRTVQHHAERPPLSLQCCQWKEGTQRVTPPPPALGLLCRSPYHDLASGRLQENLWGLISGNLTVMEKVRRGLQQPAHGTWPTESHTCSAQVVIPTGSSACLLNEIGATLWPRNLAECGSAWFRSSNEERFLP